MATFTRRSRTEWQALVTEFGSTGQSVSAFCSERGIGEASFYQWRKRLSPAESKTSEIPSFVDVSSLAAESLSSRWCVELDLGDGVTLRFNRS